MMNQIRYQQQCQQLKAARSLNISNVAIYTSRDTVTGQRQVETADGGQSIAKYVSNSEISGTISISFTSPLGLPGYINQKPH